MNKIFSENYVATISILWIVLMACLVVLKRQTLTDLELNSIGDFLAGAFAPLGFFWLVAGFYQQGKGLEQNSHALNLQAQELQQSTVALQQQAKELNETAKGQKKLIEIAAQELKQKRFEAEPNFQFRITDLDFDVDHIPDDVDEDGFAISYFTEDIVRFNFVFENIGPTARKVCLKNQDSIPIFDVHEVKQEKNIKNMRICDEDYGNLTKGQTIYKDYELSFHSIYGDHYLKSVTCQVYMVVDHEGEHLGHSISYKDLETTI